jgi:hypothetical protein
MGKNPPLSNRQNSWLLLETRLQRVGNTLNEVAKLRRTKRGQVNIAPKLY